MLKLADFGSCRGIYSKQPYTEYISTRWYRAPECLLTDGYYGYKMDLWGVGCVMFETLALYPLFPGTNEADQIERIHKISGTPSGEILEKFKHYGSTHVDFNFNQYKRHPLGLAKLLPHVSPDAIDLMHKLLLYDPDERMTAREALRHPWFTELRAAEKRQREAAKARKAGINGTEGENKEGEDTENKDSTDNNNHSNSKDDDDHHSSADSTMGNSPTNDKKSHKESTDKKGKDSTDKTANGLHIVTTGTNTTKETSSPIKDIPITNNVTKPIPSSHSGNSGGKSGGNSRNPAGLQINNQSKDNNNIQYQIQGMKITGAGPSKSNDNNNNPKVTTNNNKVSQSTSTNKTNMVSKGTNYDDGNKQVKRKDNDTLYENNTTGIDASKSLYNNIMRSPPPGSNNLQSPSVISYANSSNVKNNNKAPSGVLYGNNINPGSLSPQGAPQYLSNGITITSNNSNNSIMNNNNNNNASPTIGRSNKYGPSATNVIAAAKSEVIGINGGNSLYGLPTNNVSSTNNPSNNVQNVNGLFKAGNGGTILSPNNATNPLLLPNGARQPGNPLLSPQGASTNPLLQSPMGLMPNTMTYANNQGVQVLSPQANGMNNNNNMNNLLLQHQQLQQMNLSPLRGNIPLNPGLYGAMNNPAAAALVAAQQQAALAAAASTVNNSSNKYSTNNSQKSKNSSSNTNQLLSPQYANNNKYAGSNSLSTEKNRNNNTNNSSVPSFSFEQPSLYARRPEEKSGPRNAVNNLQSNNVNSSSNLNNGQPTSSRNNNTGRNNDSFNRGSGTSASGSSGTKANNNSSSSNSSNHLKRASDIYIAGNKSSSTTTNTNTNSSNLGSGPSVYDASSSSNTTNNKNNNNIRSNNTNNTNNNNNLLYGAAVPNNNLLVNYLGNPAPPGGYSLYGNNVSTNTTSTNTYNYGSNNLSGGVSLYGASIDTNNSSSGNAKWDVPRRRQGDKVRPLAPLYASPTSIATNSNQATNTNPVPNTTRSSSNPPANNATGVTAVPNPALSVNTNNPILSPLQQNNSSRYLSPYSQKDGKRF